MKLAILLFVPLLAVGQQPADDLARVQSEPNPEKRAHAALENADSALKQARDAYSNGNEADASVRLEEVQQSVELAETSLNQTGKNPSRSPKHFKQAELKTRDLLRKLDGFRHEMSVADRAVADRVVDAVQKIHDALLDGIMGKKK
jgi:phage shock protein A